MEGMTGRRYGSITCRFGRSHFLLPLALLFASFFARASAQTAGDADAATAAFKANCAICHGEDGSGTPFGNRLHAKDLRGKDVQAKSSDELAQTIRMGKNNMPAFGNRLDAAQIEKLIQYIRNKKVKEN
jgi:cytochrome c6